MTTLLSFLTQSIYVVFALLLVWIILEDFKHRAIRWWLFPLIGMVVLGIEFESLSLIDIIINVCFVLVQVAMLTLCFSIKEKRFVNITRKYLGWGDLLFWGMLCLLFSPLNFVVFFMISMIFTTFIVGLWKMIRIKQEIITIPLAGMQAIALLLVGLMALLSEEMSFRNDQWIECWIML